MIGDRYQLIEEIGSGGMATVWQATDKLLGRSVAVKRLLPHLARDPEAAARFKREAHAAASLNHPGIVTVFDTGEDDEGPFIVLELIEGSTLAAKVAAVGAFSPMEVVDIVTQAGSALDHAHSLGVVHRDIKPANLIVDPGGRIRLTDFGIARTIDDPGSVTETGALVGTIAYMAPELLQGDPATPASDIYSLAAVTFELVAGKPPFVAETPAAVLEAVRSTEPPDLRGLAPIDMTTAVATGMSKDPARRPASAGQFAASLTGTSTLVLASAVVAAPTAPLQPTLAGSDEPTLVHRPSPVHADPGETTPAGQRSRWPLLAVVLALAGLAAAAMTYDRSSANEQGGGLLAEETTTTVAMTSTIPTTTTTTATMPTTAAVAVAAEESVSQEIDALLATLRPPEFKPKDVRQVGDRLNHVMDEWEAGQVDDLGRELERAFEAVGKLDESSERDQLDELFIELAQLMGFEVDQSPQEGDEDD